MNNWFNFIFTILFILFVSCKQSEQDTQKQLPRSQADLAYDNFVHGPSEENFEILCKLGRESEETKFRTIYYYWVVSDFMTPVSPRRSDADLEEARIYLKKNSSSLDDSLGTVLLKHEDLWRRWTVASVIGSYGGEECLPVLKKCLELEADEIVIKYTTEAIEKIGKRKN